MINTFTLSLSIKEWIMDGQSILFENDNISVPNHPIIPYIEGDHSGIDIWTSVRFIIDKAVEKCYQGQKSIHWKELLVQDKAEEKYGKGCCLPKKSLVDIRNHHIVLKSSLNPSYHRPVKCISQEIIKRLNLYLSIIPVSPINSIFPSWPGGNKINSIIFRENLEFFSPQLHIAPESSTYQKFKKVLKKENFLKRIPQPKHSEYFILPISEIQTKKLLRNAIQFAMRLNRRKITVIHKSRYNRKLNEKISGWIRDLVRYEYPESTILGDDCGNNPPFDRILVNEEYMQDFFSRVPIYPEKYDIIIANNYISDSISWLFSSALGGVNNLYQINMNPEKHIYIFEPLKSSAPKYSGLDKANPLGLLQAGCAMLRKIKWHEAASLIQKSIHSVFSQNKMPYELALVRDGAIGLKGMEFAIEIISHFDHSEK